MSHLNDAIVMPDSSRERETGGLWRMPFLRMIAVFGVAAVLAGPLALAPAPADAKVVKVASKTLAPPKGRVRKQLMHPSIAPPPSSPSRKAFGRQAFKWFWGEVSTARSAASGDRWARVLGVIETGRAKGKAVFGSHSTVKRILNDHKPILIAEAKRRNVSVPLLLAVIAVESNGSPTARSPKGAGGLMQLMPKTAERFGVADRYQPAQNIRGGAHYLDWLLRRFGGDAVLALAGYNAGEGAVDRFKGVPPYAETRDYVAKVAGAYAVARTLCKTPPKSARGACDLK